MFTHYKLVIIHKSYALLNNFYIQILARNIVSEFDQHIQQWKHSHILLCQTNIFSGCKMHMPAAADLERQALTVSLSPQITHFNDVTFYHFYWPSADEWKAEVTKCSGLNTICLSMINMGLYCDLENSKIVLSPNLLIPWQW